MSNFKISDILKRSFSPDNVNLRELFDVKLHELNITENQAHKLLDIDKNSLNPILDGSVKQPNMFNVIKIADFLEISLESIIATILSNQNDVQIGKLEKVTEVSFLTKHFDIDKLYKTKVIDTKSDSDKIKNRLLDFFGFDDINEYEKYESELNSVLYSKSKRKFTDKMRDFSIKSAFRVFELIDNPNDYDREELKDLVTKIKPYSNDVENGLLIVCKALYNIGITVCVQHYLTTSQYRGATFIVNNKPCIVLTDLNKNYSTIWLALLHELYHVLFDFEQISKQGYHLTGQPDMFLVNEELPNEFAQDYFFDRDLYNYIKPHIHNEYLVKSFAKKNNIHPSFVYRGYQHFVAEIDGGDYWKAFHDKFPNVEKTMKNLSPLVWKEDNLKSKATTLKKIFELNTI